MPTVSTPTAARNGFAAVHPRAAGISTGTATPPLAQARLADLRMDCRALGTAHRCGAWNLSRCASGATRAVRRAYRLMWVN